MIDSYVYDITIHLKKDISIMLRTDTIGSDLEKVYRDMLRDKQGVKDSFEQLENVLLKDFVGLSLNVAHYKYGHFVNSKCIKRSNFV